MTQSADQAKETALAGWLLQQGLEGAEQEELLEGCCGQLVSAEVRLKRLHIA